jgi:hypothetical protein
VVLMLADNVGWGDIGAYGEKNLEALRLVFAAERNPT